MSELQNRRAWNSTFRPVSKKRLESGDYFGHRKSSGLKRKKPMRQMSNKMRQRIADYRAAAFERWGKKCFLCGRTINQTTLDIHHIDGRINGDNVERMVPLCHRGCGCGAHNHSGMDARFYELKTAITQQMQAMAVYQKTIEKTNPLV